jgi:hypothetical protein
MRKNYFIFIVPSLLLATFKILFTYGFKGLGLDFFSYFTWYLYNCKFSLHAKNIL